jgi:EmrB/QacA subfamily drug resistance transporter
MDETVLATQIQADEPAQANGLPRGGGIVLAAALVAVFIAALDLTVIATILPTIVYDLGVNVGEIDRYSWIVSGYLLAYLITIPIMGRLSDLAGRRLVFLVALLIFTVGSVWCVLARTLEAVIAARALQGLGGGALVPVTHALAADLLPRERRAAAVGAIGAIDTLGWVLGPLWGAAIIGLLGTSSLGPIASWRWVFAINGPLALVVVVLLILTWRRAAIPEHRAGGRFDWLGALLLTLSLVLLNLAISSGAESSAGGSRAFGAAANPFAPYRAPLLIGAACAFVAFLVLELRVAGPLIPLTLFHNRVFSAATVANFLVGAALIVVMVDVPILVALLASDTASASTISALLLTPFTAAMAVGALGGGIVTERLGYRTLATAGLVLAAVGFWRFWGWPVALAYGRMAIDLTLCGLGLGLVIAPVGTAAINHAPRPALGIASSLVMVLRLLGMTVGISGLTAWGSDRLNQAIVALPPLAQQPGETLAAYYTRQAQFAAEQTITLTAGILHETFAIAGVVCLVAVIPALMLGSRRSLTAAEPPVMRGLR